MIQSLRWINSLMQSITLGFIWITFFFFQLRNCTNLKHSNFSQGHFPYGWIIFRFQKLFYGHILARLTVPTTHNQSIAAFTHHWYYVIFFHFGFSVIITKSSRQHTIDLYVVCPKRLRFCCVVAVWKLSNCVPMTVRYVDWENDRFHFQLSISIKFSYYCGYDVSHPILACFCCFRRS